MNILIACEYSGIVREAFKANGHFAMSCDLLPTEIPGEHYQGDVFDGINDGWDMMIGFPPCTHLAVSGSRFTFKQFIADLIILAFVMIWFVIINVMVIFK